MKVFQHYVQAEVKLYFVNINFDLMLLSNHVSRGECIKATFGQTFIDQKVPDIA